MRYFKLRFLLILSVIFLLSFWAYAIYTAPSKVESVSVDFEGKGAWKEKVVSYALSLVQLGEPITPDYLKYIKNRLLTLPWVEEVEVKARKGKLLLWVRGEPLAFILFFNGKYYLIGDNDFVLGEASSREGLKKVPLFFYKGKTSPFTLSSGFLKLKKVVKMEIKITTLKRKELILKGEEPSLALSDGYVVASFPLQEVVVFLGPEERSWDRFLSYKERAVSLNSGIYDFRFYDMLVREGTNDKQ